MFSILPALTDDIPVLRDLARRIWHAHYPGIITPEQIDYMLGRMYDADVIRREMAEGVLWHLALVDDEPVGFISCGTEPAARSVKLHKLYLLPELHGRGMGRQMLGFVKTLAVGRRAREIRLQVNRRNTRAIRAYERAGFRVRDSVIADIGGGFVMDDFIMVLTLGEWEAVSR